MTTKSQSVAAACSRSLWVFQEKVQRTKDQLLGIEWIIQVYNIILMLGAIIGLDVQTAFFVQQRKLQIETPDHFNEPLKVQRGEEQ